MNHNQSENRCGELSQIIRLLPLDLDLDEVPGDYYYENEPVVS